MSAQTDLATPSTERTESGEKDDQGKDSDKVHLDGPIPLSEFDDPNIDKTNAILGLLEDDSPYPEVRSAVANTDDTTIPVSTVRSWVMGIVWAILISGLNQFFYFRYPSVEITSIVAQLLAFPIGRAWARFVPNISIFGLELNPGPFSIKEHVLVTIMATVGSGSAYATDIVAVQRVYYHQSYNFGCESSSSVFHFPNPTPNQLKTNGWS